MSEAVLRRENGATKGRLVLSRDGAEAELTWSVTSPTRWIADHTGVPDSMRGTGAGKLMVERLVAEARAEGVTIIALCPFVRSQAVRHPEWADVFV